MKLEISETIPLILAIPAHRSHNEGHRKLGERAIELLFSYKESSSNIEDNYNTAMIGAVLSSVRAFSVERDSINEKWKKIEYIKKRRERLLKMFQNISPLSSGNYWSKLLVLVGAGGFSLSHIILNGYQDTPWFIYYLILFLICLEFISKIGEYIFAEWIEISVPKEKLKEWEKYTLTQYKKILENFLEEAVDIHLRYYTDKKELYGFNLADDDSKENFKNHLINLHFSMFYKD